MRKKGARAFVSKVWSQISGEVSTRVPRAPSAAALTSALTEPKALPAVSMRARQAPTSARSSETKRVSQPRFVNRATAFAPFASSRPARTRRRQPSSASRVAIASPTPCAPPVTTATVAVCRCVSSVMRAPLSISRARPCADRRPECALHPLPPHATQARSDVAGDVSAARLQAQRIHRSDLRASNIVGVTPGPGGSTSATGCVKLAPLPDRSNVSVAGAAP